MHPRRGEGHVRICISQKKNARARSVLSGQLQDTVCIYGVSISENQPIGKLRRHKTAQPPKFIGDSAKIISFNAAFFGPK